MRVQADVYLHVCAATRPPLLWEWCAGFVVGRGERRRVEKSRDEEESRKEKTRGEESREKNRSGERSRAQTTRGEKRTDEKRRVEKRISRHVVSTTDIAATHITLANACPPFPP